MLNDVQTAAFWDKVAKQGPDDCWPWQRALSSNGYGSVSIMGRAHRAHRVAYVLEHGRIAPGVVIRHKCDNPLCCNPRHLEPGSNVENMQDMRERGRWRGIAAENAVATHCVRGHEFDEANTQRRGKWRICRACNRERQATMRAAMAVFMKAEDGAMFEKVDGQLRRAQS